MLKRIMSFLMAAVLLLLCFGCGAKTPDDPSDKPVELADGSKIALIVGSAAQELELAAAAEALAAQYGDALVVLNYPEKFATEDEALTSVADKAMQDKDVKAVIFAGGVNGTAKAAARVRELRSDTCIAVCNPLEGVDSVRLTANLIFSIDLDAYADALVKNAKAMGAKNLIFYTTDRELQLSVPSTLRGSVMKKCKAEKLTCKAAAGIDRYEKGKTADLATEYILADAERKLLKYGENTALFGTDPFVQGALAQGAANQKIYMPSVFLPSPILLATELGIDIAGHETDSAFALKALQDAAAENGTKGRVSTWSFSEPVVSLLAAMEYAAAVTRGDAGLRVDADQVAGYVQAHTDAAFTFSESGYDNVYLFNGELVTL